MKTVVVRNAHDIGIQVEGVSYFLVTETDRLDLFGQNQSLIGSFAAGHWASVTVEPTP